MKNNFVLLLLILPAFILQCRSIAPPAEKKTVPLAEILSQISEETLTGTMWHNADTTISNEARLDLFKTAMADSPGGIYIGVGSIQNLTLAAWAKSEFVYLMDFTEVVVFTNKAHVAFLKESSTPADYLALWGKPGTANAEAILKKHYGHSSEYNYILKSYYKSAPFFRSYIVKMKTASARFSYKIYFQDDELYQYVRQLALAGKIRPVRGNLLGSTTLKSIAAAAEATGMKIGVIYFSNAEEYNIFKPYPAGFISNIRALPVNGKSLVLRTLSVFKWTHEWAEGSEIFVDNGFHYGAEPLTDFQNCLENDKTLYVYDLFKAGKPLKPGVTIAACPAVK